MKILHNKFFVRELGPILALDALLWLSVPVISDLAMIIYFFWLPGSIMMTMAGKEVKQTSWTTILHTVALSVFFTLTSGLWINYTGPALGFKHPLEKGFLLVGFNILLLGLLVIKREHFKGKRMPRAKNPFKPIKGHMTLGILPLMSIAGALMLNSGGSNVITMALIAVVAALIFFYAQRATKLSDDFIMSGIYFISLSLLFMVSMRGWHITGYDISKELMVFHLTQSSLFWNMSAYQDAYNACMSITILPTIISQFTYIPDEYIYKFLFQLIFALMPVAFYRFARLFSSTQRMAFLATTFCIVQSWFFEGMPALVRQEFGILFFTLIMAVIFDKSLGKNTRNVLAFIYGVGMVISHYSTTYIAIALLLGVFVANRLIPVYDRFSAKRSQPHPMSHLIKPYFLAFLVLTVMVWNTSVTHTSNNLSEFITKSSTGVNKMFTSDILFSTLSQLAYKQPAQMNLDSYIQKSIDEFHENHGSYRFYSAAEMDQKPMQETWFKPLPARFGKDAYNASMAAFKWLKIINNNIFIVFGMVYLFFLWLRRKFVYSEFILFSITGFAILFSLMVIPGALQEYNLERLYFQMLIVWSMVGVFGGIQIMKRIVGLGAAYKLLALGYIGLLLYYSGFLFNIFGGPGVIAMSNTGEEYEKFYAMEQDVKAAQWLGKNYDGNDMIYTNSHGANQLIAFSGISDKKVIRETLPANISKDSYVFSTYINTVGNKAMFNFNGSEYAYTYPSDFLEENKNLIYSNGISKIYK